jgi:adenosylcobinamide-GDP ribazoletransferase
VAAIIGGAALPSFVPVALGMGAAAALVGWLAKRQIGGFTGDVLGAAQIAAEIAGLALLARGG